MTVNSNKQYHSHTGNKIQLIILKANVYVTKMDTKFYIIDIPNIIIININFSIYI